ncbi:MAG: glycoside hydrolase family 3 C-terminal domain-containing protein [Flavisolibacter sp.]|nr:glycoside hydrolase family 3 C-terminal domain-containing protein [Flavisolibacter sp.]
MNKVSSLFSTLLLLVLSGTASAQSKSLPQLGKSPLKEVIAAMTLEEKAKLVVGTGMRFGPPPAATNRRDSTNRRDTGNRAPAPSGPVIGQTNQKVPGAAGTTFAVPRLGIPSIVVADGPAGLRIAPIRNGDSSKTYYATAFPVATLLASTWDTALVKKVGMAFGNEVHEYGVDILLAPALNIHRNPLGGRNFEYYSEDPVVSGKMTAAIVNGIESNGVGTSIKHFAANNQETNRNTINTIVSERALREIYLRGFELAVKEAQPWTVMSSYNKINGTYTSESYDLLTTILRNEWGFKGLVMTDWFGGRDPIAQMKAGNDLLMPGTPQQAQRIIDAVNHDSLDVKVLDKNVERILNVILLSPTFKGYQYSNKPDLKSNAAVSRSAAAEGMVLLKNNNTLPLTGAKKVAVFGNTSYDIIAGGTGSGDVNKAYTVSLLQGLGNAGYTVDESLKNRYTAYIADAKAKRPRPRGIFDVPKPISELLFDTSEMVQKASDADVALLTIGRNAGEGADRKLENDFNLSDTERVLIKNIADVFHAKNKKLVVVLNIGGVIETASWRDNADAILLAWQPGLEAGNAITDVLSGKVNPSGKLATTFPVSYNDVPSSKNFPGKEFPDQASGGGGFMRSVPAEVTYEEGIYVGYRYFNTYNVKPAYEFGYGLSYTNFTYDNLKLNSATFNGKLTASVTITNSGMVAGKEAVQLYLSAPAKKLDKPALELKAFAKTSLLQPGQSQSLTFVINNKDLASFDPQTSSWIAEAGAYKVSIGASSQNIKQTASFTLAKDMVVEKDNKVLTPQVSINEMQKKSF